jgi:hypothetical protein
LPSSPKLHSTKNSGAMFWVMSGSRVRWEQSYRLFFGLQGDCRNNFGMQDLSRGQEINGSLFVSTQYPGWKSQSFV